MDRDKRVVKEPYCEFKPLSVIAIGISALILAFVYYIAVETIMVNINLGRFLFPENAVEFLVDLVGVGFILGLAFLYVISPKDRYFVIEDGKLSLRVGDESGRKLWEYPLKELEIRFVKFKRKGFFVKHYILAGIVHKPTDKVIWFMPFYEARRLRKNVAVASDEALMRQRAIVEELSDSLGLPIVGLEEVGFVESELGENMSTRAESLNGEPEDLEGLKKSLGVVTREDGSLELTLKPCAYEEGLKAGGLTILFAIMLFALGRFAFGDGEVENILILTSLAVGFIGVLFIMRSLYPAFSFWKILLTKEKLKLDGFLLGFNFKSIMVPLKDIVDVYVHDTRTFDLSLSYYNARFTMVKHGFLVFHRRNEKSILSLGPVPNILEFRRFLEKYLIETIGKGLKGNVERG